MSSTPHSVFKTEKGNTTLEVYTAQEMPARAKRPSHVQPSRPKPDPQLHCVGPDTLVAMRAVVIPRFGGPEVLQVRDVPKPIPSADEVLVKVEAAGMNFADVLTVSGGYPGLPSPPIIAGREFAGQVDGTGERVMGYAQSSAFGEFIAASRRLLWPVPRQWTAEQAAAFPVNYFTAYLAYWKASLTDRPRGAPARVLIHAVAGGVGTAAVEIGKLLGIEMYGTSSSEEKLARVRQLGLDHGINYKQRDYEEAISELTGGDGVDVVFEMLGGKHLSKSIRCLRELGRIISYGAVTGEQAQLDPRLLYQRATSVHGLWLTQLCHNRDLMSSAWQPLGRWAIEGKLSPVVGHTLPLAEVGKAYRLLLGGKNFGKVVLQIASPS
ncbi:MAG: NADPH:quinone oxidoreductase family protein [Acidobacteria bacterium]|nr:NADPH:quinone oxidoreductase family protein [Acidobacteriota bacterium]